VDIVAPAINDSDVGATKSEEGVGEIGVAERGVDEGKNVRERNLARFCE
jgi:hypothetical protein